MEENTPLKPTNKILEFFKGNQKLVLLTGGVTVLFLIIISSIITMNTVADPSVKRPTPTPRQASSNPTAIPTKVPVVPTKVLTQQENNTVVGQVDAQLKDRVDISYSVSNVKGYGDEWAMFEITNPSTDPAKVVVKKENGKWVIKLGPGTSFDESQLRSIGAPQNLIDEINKPL